MGFLPLAPISFGAGSEHLVPVHGNDCDPQQKTKFSFEQFAFHAVTCFQKLWLLRSGLGNRVILLGLAAEECEENHLLRSSV